MADNTAIMLTDVARRVEQMDTILKRSLGIEEDDDGDAIEQKVRIRSLLFYLSHLVNMHGLVKNYRFHEAGQKIVGYPLKLLEVS